MRRPSDPERPRNRDYSPSRRSYQPRDRIEPQRDRGSFPRSGGDYQQENRTRNTEGLRLDTQMANRTRDDPATRTPNTASERGQRSPDVPYSSASGARRYNHNHAQRRTAKWKAGGGNKKGRNNNQQQQRQHQYQNRKAWNRNRKPSDDTQSPTSRTLPRPPSPDQKPSSSDENTTRMCHYDGPGSPMLNPSAVSLADLDHAKDIVLDLLGWGVPPQYLLDRGVSPQLVHRIFTDLQLQLPQGFVLTSSHETDAPIPT